MKYRHLLLLCIITTSLNAVAQKSQKVTASYTYYAPENVTPEQAKRTALERAQLQAIADAFGTIVAQINATKVKNRNGKSEFSLLSLGTSEVKGEWIETIGQPTYKIENTDGMQIVSVTVQGIIREIVNAPVDFKAKILCNGTEDKFEREEFHDGDDLYLSFQSPIDGYLTVYLIDHSGTAYCLLPYRNDTRGRVAVKGNRPYLFFSVKEAPVAEANLTDEYTLTCSGMSELNQIYIIFSPQLFTKAVDNGSDKMQPREISHEAFRKWLFKCRKQDREMRVEVKNILITK